MHLLIIGCLVCHASLAQTASLAQNVPPNIWPAQWPPAPPIRPAPSLPVPTVPTIVQNSVPSSNAASSPPAPQQNMSALLQSLIQQLDYPRRQKTLALLSRYRQLYLQSLLAQRAQQLRSLNQQTQKVISPQRATSQPAQNVISQPTPSVANQQTHSAQPPNTAQKQIPTVFRPRPPAGELFQFQPHLFPTPAAPQRVVASPSVQSQPSTASPSVPPAETVEEPEEVDSPDPSDSEGDEDDDSEEADADEEEPVEHSTGARASPPLSLPSGDAFSILRKISGNGQGSAGVLKQKPQLSVQSQPSAAAVHQQYQQFLQHAAKLNALKKTPPHQTHLPLNPPTQQRAQLAPPVQVSPKPNTLPALPPFLRPQVHQAQPGTLARPFLFPFQAPINSTRPQPAIPSFLFPLAPKSSTPAPSVPTLPSEPIRPQSLASQQLPRLPSFPLIRNPLLTTQSPPVLHAQSTTSPTSSVETLIEPSSSPSFPTVTEKPVDDDADFPWESFRAYLRSSSNSAPKIINTKRVNEPRAPEAVKVKTSVAKVDSEGHGNSAVESDKTSEPKPKDWWHHYFLLERPQSELEPKPERANKWWLKYKEEKPSSIAAEQGQNNVGLWEAISRHEQEVQEQKEEEDKKQRRQERWGKVKEVFSSLLNKLTN